MFREIFLNIFYDMWPMLIICSVILITLRIAYLIKNKTPFIFYKDILLFGFIIYNLVLFKVVTFQDVSWSTSNLIPFKEIFRYQLGSKMFYKNVIGNMLMFIPYGFFISYFIKLNKCSASIVLTFLLSITIEITQLAIGRVFDVDDILLNVIGGIIGFYLFKIVYDLKLRFKILQKPFIYNIIMVIILILILLYMLGVFYV